MGEPIGKREIFRKYPDVVDVPQLCEMLGGSRPVSKKTAYRMLNAGKIKAFRIGRSYRIPKVNVIRFLQKETPADCNTVNGCLCRASTNKGFQSSSGCLGAYSSFHRSSKRR